MPFLPPETLYDIIAFAVLHEVDDYIRGATKNPRKGPYSPLADIPATASGTRGFTDALALIGVSAQFRDITLKVIQDAFHMPDDTDSRFDGHKFRSIMEELRLQWASLGERPDLDLDHLFLTPPQSLDDLDQFTGFRAPLAQGYVLAAHMRALDPSIRDRLAGPQGAVGAGGGQAGAANEVFRDMDFLSRGSKALKQYGDKLEALIEDIRPTILASVVRGPFLYIVQNLRRVQDMSEVTLGMAHQVLKADNPFSRLLATIETTETLSKLIPPQLLRNVNLKLNLDKKALKLVREYDPSQTPIPTEVKDAVLTLQRQVNEWDAAVQFLTA